MSERKRNSLSRPTGSTLILPVGLNWFVGVDFGSVQGFGCVLVRWFYLRQSQPYSLYVFTTHSLRSLEVQRAQSCCFVFSPCLSVSSVAGG
jgi:hypothetical protein